jgi:hypothetical protein
VRRSCLDRYEVHTVGGRVHQEYWIPAEDFEEIKRNLVAPMEMIARFGSLDGE